MHVSYSFVHLVTYLKFQLTIHKGFFLNENLKIILLKLHVLSLLQNKEWFWVCLFNKHWNVIEIGLHSRKSL
jgi:hypothetical protein